MQKQRQENLRENYQQTAESDSDARRNALHDLAVLKIAKLTFRFSFFTVLAQLAAMTIVCS
jgi:hypothetical protein